MLAADTAVVGDEALALAVRTEPSGAVLVQDMVMLGGVYAEVRMLLELERGGLSLLPLLHSNRE